MEPNATMPITPKTTTIVPYSSEMKLGRDVNGREAYIDVGARYRRAH
jgi:hypothetical protein